MKYFNDFQYDVEPEHIKSLLDQSKPSSGGTLNEETLSQIFSLLDITSLSEKDNNERIGKLCEQINLLSDSYPSIPPPAAICVYPEFVSTVKNMLNNPLVNIASVGGGFPSSQTYMEVKLKEIEMALDNGADEIDIVISVGKFQLGLTEEVFEEIAAIKNLMGPLVLKVILETGSLNGFNEVRKAAILSMDAGADFIKTSTGKAGSGASTDSFSVMCEAIKDFHGKTGKKVGIKPAGGIGDSTEAIKYVGIVQCILGDEWLNSEKFRIGASKLADDLIRKILKKDDTFSYFH